MQTKLTKKIPLKAANEPAKKIAISKNNWATQKEINERMNALFRAARKNK